MKKPPVQSLFITALPVILLMACQQPETAGNGGRAIGNTGENEHLEMVQVNDRFKLEKVGEIILEENDTHLISLPLDMDVAANGDIYIADYRQNTIHQYDLSGRFLRRIGRLGDGPGEFQDLQKVRVVRDHLVAYDIRPRKMQFFDLSGKYLRTVSTLLASDMYTGDEFDFSADGKTFYIEAGEHDTNADEHCRQSFTFAVYDSNFAVRSRAGRHDPYLWDRCVLLGAGSIVRTDAKSRIYVLPKRLPRLTVYSPDFRELGRFGFKTSSWVFPKPTKSLNSRFNQSHSSNDAVLMGQRTGRIYILSSFYNREASVEKKRSISDFTLNVLAATGELLFSRKVPLVGPLAPIATDAEEILYFFTERTPDRLKIGKYRLREAP